MKQTEVSKKQESSKLSQSQNETKHITISKIPKNVNQYSHLIDCYYITGSDIEYMLALRHYDKLGPVSKDLSTNSPSFYDKDLEKYRKRIELTKDEKMKLKTNLAVFDHVIDHKAGQPANRSILDFETMLRKSEKGVIKKNINPNPWNSTSFPKTKNLFDPFLPPILEQSKNNLERNKDKIARKLIQINTSSTINGEKVRQRKFDMSPNITLRSLTEHCPSSRYNNNFGIKNIGSISHLLNFDNINATTLWGGNLRDYGKKIKFKQWKI